MYVTFNPTEDIGASRRQAMMELTDDGRAAAHKADGFLCDGAGGSAA
jgi:hypothetical protein